MVFSKVNVPGIHTIASNYATGIYLKNIILGRKGSEDPERFITIYYSTHKLRLIFIKTANSSIFSQMHNWTSI